MESSARTIESLLGDVTTRQKCNIVMGCPAEAELVAHGNEATAPIINRFRTLSKPTYQKYHLIDLLGRIGDAAALPFLRECLDQRHWEARTRAAIAIGALGARTELTRLSERLQSAPVRDHAYRYALAYAVEKLGGEGGQAVLLEGLQADAINSRNWGYTRVAVERIRELGITQACPLLPQAIRHKDIFLKKAGILAAGDLECKGPEVLRAVATGLRERVPSVRKTARGALQKLTGITFSSAEQWEEYAKSLP